MLERATVYYVRAATARAEAWLESAVSEDELKWLADVDVKRQEVLCAFAQESSALEKEARLIAMHRLLKALLRTPALDVGVAKRVSRRAVLQCRHRHGARTFRACSEVADLEASIEKHTNIAESCKWNVRRRTSRIIIEHGLAPEGAKPAPYLPQPLTHGPPGLLCRRCRVLHRPSRRGEAPTLTEPRWRVCTRLSENGLALWLDGVEDGGRQDSRNRTPYPPLPPPPVATQAHTLARMEPDDERCIPFILDEVLARASFSAWPHSVRL
ncbi:hypothetical protein T492DRAFT_835402 [Pavlovales sp. CCMP2436]|nr:hypothetical protein T492DRAFT_835402 [Pavlovales sp. CCMP2436]